MEVQVIKINDRIESIDFAKGFLVIMMVVYHTLNYFYNGPADWYKYIGFVRASFIFLSGFLCGTVYLDKFNKKPVTVFLRLNIRAIKIFIIFLLVNIFIHLVIKKNYNNQELGINVLFHNIGSILIFGNSNIIAFEILLPISYMLIASSFLLVLKKLKYIFFVLLLAFYFYISFMNYDIGYNLHGLIIGIGGFFVGIIYLKFPKLRNIFINLLIVIITFVFFCVIIPLTNDLIFILYFLFVSCTVGLICILGNLMIKFKMPINFINLLGKYSLILYLIHIFLLQILNKLISIDKSIINIWHLTIFFVITLCIIICSYIIDYLRSKIKIINDLYVFIFG